MTMTKLLTSLLIWASLAVAQTQFNTMVVTSQGQFVNANLNNGNIYVDFSTSPPTMRARATAPTATALGGVFAGSCVGKIMTGIDTTGRIICSDIPAMTYAKPIIGQALTYSTDGSYSVAASVNPVGSWIVVRNGLEQSHGEDYKFDTVDSRRIIPIWKKDDGTTVDLVGDICSATSPDKDRCWNSDGKDLVKAHIFY